MENRAQPPGSILFNRYEILAHLGAGGMGQVYKVIDQDSDEILALKTLIQKNGVKSKSVERFQKEFISMQALEHPNIVRAYNFHQDNTGLLGFSMELVEGYDLDSLIYSESKVLEIPHKLILLEQIASGLAHAHNQNLVHRDLKPANILVANYSSLDLHAKIVDFGLAQNKTTCEDLSKSDTRIGTAYYMSPEQHRGEELDKRTDIYSFGILAFELFTKKRPFDGNTPFKLFLAHVSQGIPEVRKINPDVPKWLSTMIEICAEKDKNHRYANMDEVISLINDKKKKATKSLFNFLKS